MRNLAVVMAAVLLSGAAAPLWADDSSDSQDQAVSQMGAGGANGQNQGGNSFSAPLKSQFNTSPNNSPNPANPNGSTGSAVPSGQINTSHELLQSQIQATNGAVAGQPVSGGTSSVAPNVSSATLQKVSVPPSGLGGTNSGGVSSIATGKISKASKALSSKGKGLSKVTSLKNSISLPKNNLPGTGVNGNLPAVQK
jgi:hypothetical protein